MTSSINLLTAATAPTAPSGFRTVVFWWKTSKTTGKMLSPKKYSHIPVVNIPGQMDDKSQLSIFIRSAFEDAQDGYLKGLIESRLTSIPLPNGIAGDSGEYFTDEQLTFQSTMNDFFSARSSGGRLTGDMIEEWFMSDMFELLELAVTNKIGTEDVEKVASIVVGYCDKYKKLASGAVKYPVIVAKNLLDNIQKVSSQSEIKDKLMKRLEPMTKEVTAESEGLI